MRTSETLTKIAPDLVAALSEMEGAAKSATNPHFRSKYANLETVVETSRPVLAAHGLAVMQGAGAISAERCLTVTTRIIHKSGEWVESDFEIPLAKQDPQATLAALTYARRGSLMSILGMPAVDDDGETAMGREPDAKPPHPRLDVAPLGPDFWNCDGPGMTANAAKKAGMDLIHDGMRTAISEIHSATAMREWIEANLEDIRKMPRSWRAVLREDCELKREEFGPTENDRRAA